MESNFDFLKPEFVELFDAARRAESYARSDARASCVYSRMALETAVLWLYEHDKRLELPYDTNLGSLLHATEFRNVVPEPFFHKAKAIQKAGNLAVHNTRRPVKQWDAQHVVRELFHALYWVARTYHRKALGEVGDFNVELIPRPVSGESAGVSDTQLKQQEAQLARKAKELEEREKQIDERLREVQEQIAAAREANAQEPDTHDYSEAETRTFLIDLELKRAGWALDQKRDREYEVTGMPNDQGIGYVDYVLWGNDGKPLAVVEAKRTRENVDRGKQQAKLYADCLEQMHGRRPVIYFTNGYQIFIWDDVAYPSREVAGYHSSEELELMIQRRDTRVAPESKMIDDEITDRYYQKRAIMRVSEEFVNRHRKALLVMATGTGKTRTAISLVDVLQRCNWVKRVLFLADRVSLVRQAVNAFKNSLPESSPVNLVTDRTAEGRVYVCTYPTMMGLIDDTEDGVARFGSGHFDLIIIDEAHRSVYQKYRHIFRYFDALLLGLTATPRDHVDKNTYDLFDLETGVPTDAYELDKAVLDGYLVPPRATQVDLRFPSRGITYDDLSEEEKAQWESSDWGDRGDGDRSPRHVNAGAVNQWLFNKNTVDSVLMKLMEEGHKVEGGDRLAKTIIFARNHDHAVFIEERFNAHYPHYSGNFARLIDNKVKYSQSLIDDFSIKDKDPHIAISVDMLDTGIDVPEVANLVFFKPVYSRTKFWQMIGRGTRLCEDLFGPGKDKEDFRIFDFCGNFRYFGENPQGIEGDSGMSLEKRLFTERARLISMLDRQEDLAESSRDVRNGLAERLREEVCSMPKKNFLVRMEQEVVERFESEDAWESIGNDEFVVLSRRLAGLPNGLPTEKLQTKQFDLLCLRMQLGLLEGASGSVEKLRQKIVSIAEELETKPNVPMIREKLAFIQSVQQPEFWVELTVEQIEEVRLNLRELAQFIEKDSKNKVYTDFQDEVIAAAEVEPIRTPRMTSVQYEKKVADYLKGHLDNIVIQKLRMNEPLTQTDLESLEEMLVRIGDEQGKELLDLMLERNEAPSLAYFIKKLVGMDRSAAMEMFSEYMSDRSLNSAQQRFVELLVDQLTARGVVENDALYEPPFSDLHDEGPDALFEGRKEMVEGLFQILESVKRSAL